MSRWRYICGITTFLLLAVVLAVNVVGSPMMHYYLKTQTEAFLEDSGLEQASIAELKTHYHRNEDPAYTVECRRNDTEEVHWYAFNSEGQIQEIQP